MTNKNKFDFYPSPDKSWRHLIVDDLIYFDRTATRPMCRYGLLLYETDYLVVSANFEIELWITLDESHKKPYCSVCRLYNIVDGTYNDLWQRYESLEEVQQTQIKMYEGMLNRDFAVH